MSKPGTSLKVFISYARRDGAAFAEELVDALDVAGFDAFLDRNDIAAGEDWERRLEGLIAAADTVVFVVTPGSLASERCGWEVSTATGLSKRIIPVVAVEVPADASLPGDLARLNYIFFTRGQTYSRALKQLAEALTTDAEWLREQTRIAELMERWTQRGHPDVLLLRGPELEVARQWAASTRDGGPQPTEPQRNFIEVSAQHEKHVSELEAARLAAVGVEQVAKEEALKRVSRRTRLGVIASGLLAMAAVGLALWSVNAEGRFREAQREAAEARAHSIDTQIAREARRADITGQLIAYAMAPTDIRLGADDRARFTTAVTSQLLAADTSIAEAFTQAQETMRGDSTSPRPLLSTSLNGKIYLGRPASARKLEALVVTAGHAGADDADADAWEGTLRDAGFRVRRLVNPTRTQFDTGLAAFLGNSTSGARSGSGSSAPTPTLSVGPSLGASTAAEPNTLYLFVFVGEAAQLDGRTRLGFSDTSSADFAGTTASLDSVAASLAQRAAASVLVVDAAFTLSTGTSTLGRSR